MSSQSYPGNLLHEHIKANQSCGRTRSGRICRTYALRILPAAIVALPVGFYLLSDGRLEEIGNMRMWRYLEPYDLLIAAQQYLGIYIPFKSWLTRLVFGVVVAFALINLWRKPMIENAWMASFALLSAIMFTWLGHVWPWFYVWLLPFAALLPNRLLARFVIGAAMVAPFSILNVWNVPNIGDGHSIPASLAVYGAAFGLMLVSSWLKWRID